MFEDNIVFKRGIEHFRISSESQSVLMLVQFIEYFAHEKPTVYLYLKPAVSDNGTLENINEQYQLYYNECLKVQKSKRVWSFTINEIRSIVIPFYPDYIIAQCND